MNPPTVQKTREYVLYLKYKPNDKHQNMSATLEPVPFNQFPSIADKETVRCVEGILKNLYPLETKKADGSDHPYPFRNGVLESNGLRFNIKFAQECNADDSWRGKKIRVSCSSGKNGLTGIKMDRWGTDEKKHKLSVTKTANIEVLGGAAGVTQPNTPQAGTASSPAPSPSHSVNGGGASGGSRQGSNEPAETRIADLLRIYTLVGRYVTDDPELEGLSGEDKLKLATTVYLSFKEGYIHNRPHFAHDPRGAQTMAQTETLVNRAATATAEEEPEPEDREDHQQEAPVSMGRDLSKWRDYQIKRPDGAIVLLGSKTAEQIDTLHAYLHDPLNAERLDNPEMKELTLYVNYAQADLNASKGKYRPAEDGLPV